MVGCNMKLKSCFRRDGVKCTAEVGYCNHQVKNYKEEKVMNNQRKVTTMTEAIALIKEVHKSGLDYHILEDHIEIYSGKELLESYTNEQALEYADSIYRDRQDATLTEVPDAIKDIVRSIVYDMHGIRRLWDAHESEWDPDEMANKYPFGISYDDIDWVSWAEDLNIDYVELISAGGPVNDLHIIGQMLQHADRRLIELKRSIYDWANTDSLDHKACKERIFRSFPDECNKLIQGNNQLDAWAASLEDYHRRLAAKETWLLSSVPEDMGCPVCGERDMNELDPLEGEGYIVCRSCKIVYDMNEAGIPIVGHHIESAEDAMTAIYGSLIDMSDIEKSLIVRTVRQEAENFVECANDESDYRDHCATATIADKLYELSDRIEHNDDVRLHMDELTEVIRILREEVKNAESDTEDARSIEYSRELMILKGGYLRIGNTFDLLDEDEKEYWAIAKELGIAFNEWDVLIDLPDLRSMRDDSDFAGKMIKRNQKASVSEVAKNTSDNIVEFLKLMHKATQFTTEDLRQIIKLIEEREDEIVESTEK